MKIVNGVKVHTIEMSEQSIATIHRLAMLSMAPYQKLLDEIAPQLQSAEDPYKNEPKENQYDRSNPPSLASVK